MKIIICGTEEFNDEKYLFQACEKIISRKQYYLEITNSGLEIVSGNNPRGADHLGEKFAEKHGLKLKLFPAEWNNMNPSLPDWWGDKPLIFPGTSYYGAYNKMAGFIRNQIMVNYLVDDPHATVIAFRINKSKGTSDTIARAKRRGYEVYQIDYDLGKLKVWNKEDYGTL